ncbi:MAG: DUF72 domain-containing protein [Patescibacteria group bacterium]
MSKAYIGTSGFSYPHWGDGIFYPKGLPQRKWFEYYCQHFSTVELNVSFYRLPKKEAFSSWRKRAGKDFVFSIKGSRFVTHVKKLKDCEEAVKTFFDAASPLRGSTSQEIEPPQEKNVVLWQLPPGLAFDELRLKKFLAILPRTWRHAFEFRNETWLCSEVFSLLRHSNKVAVFQDYPDWPMTREATADFVYIRFHGNRVLYSSEYTEEELETWALDIKKWLKQGKDVYAYFNNDALGYAIENAKTLKKLVIGN